MSEVSEDVRYAASHEWAKLDEDGTVLIGISDHAQGLLGDVVFVELPEIERQIRQGEEISVIESVKAASDIFAPMSGEVLEVNEALNDQPNLVNEDAFQDGWIFKIKPFDLGEWDQLMPAADYEELLAQEAEV